tara:strand:- start:21160 stop:21513 length:354 start_codon:yes stop_codon:yes gene_type:complete
MYWSPKDDAILRQCYNVKTHDEIASRLCRSAKACADRARRLNIVGSCAKRWSEEDHDYLMRNYTRKKPQEIAAHLNRTLVAVNLRASAYRNGNKLPRDKRNFNLFITGKIGAKPTNI